MKVKKFFRASHGLISATHLYALPSAVHIANAHKWIHMGLHTMCPLPSIFLDPPLPSVPGGRSLHTHSNSAPHEDHQLQINAFSFKNCRKYSTCMYVYLTYIKHSILHPLHRRTVLVHSIEDSVLAKQITCCNGAARHGYCFAKLYE